jgi:hypothetical protein
VKYTTFGSTLNTMTPGARPARAASVDAVAGSAASPAAGRRSRRTRRIAGGMALAAALAAGALTVGPAAPAEAAVSRNTTILLVHGFDGGNLFDLNLPFDSAVNCNDPVIRDWKNELIERGFTDVRTVGYYAGDRNCDIYVPDRADNTVNTSLVEIGQDFALLVANTFTAQNRTVAVSAHSLGGIIARQAIAGVTARRSGYPTSVRIADVVTSGTAHAGARAADICAGFLGGLLPLQCRQMPAGSTYLSTLPHNPQGTGGTDWTLIGSECDDVATAASATTMNQVSNARPAISRTIFRAPSLIEGGCLLGSQGFDHAELITEEAPVNRISLGLTTNS